MSQKQAISCQLSSIKFKQALAKANNVLSSHPVSLTAVKGNLYLQFSTNIQFDGSRGKKFRSKYSVAKLLGVHKCADTAENVAIALEEALKLSRRLLSSTFSWDDYSFWIPSAKLPPHLKQKLASSHICQELIAEYQDYYWATHDFSTPEAAYRSTRGWQKTYLPFLQKLPTEGIFNENAILQALQAYKVNSRTRQQAISRLKGLANYHGIKINWDKFQYSGKLASKKARELSEEEIVAGWQNIKQYQPKRGKKSKYQDLFAWMYGMMAVYGLRNHETLNIQNLTQPFKHPTINLILPAFNDPRNQDKVIYTYGKTGDRLQALPYPPAWIKLFELENIPNFPDLSNLKQKDKLINQFTHFCRGTGGRYKKRIDFRPYDLRHTYAIRCRKQGFNPLDIKDYMGHSLAVHEKIYNKSIKSESLLENARKYRNQANLNTQSENELLKEQIELLNQQMQKLLSRLT